MVAFVFVMTRAGRVMRGARERAREANARAIADGGVTQLHARGGRARRSPESGGVCPWTNENEQNLAAWESPKVPASLEKIRLQTMTKSGRHNVSRGGVASQSMHVHVLTWPLLLLSDWPQLCRQPNHRHTTTCQSSCPPLKTR